jgi:hypothetical protein
MLIGFILYVLMVVARWKMFVKAGQPGWKAIIPVYNTYTLYEVVWDTRFFWIYLATCLLYFVCTAFSGAYVVQGNQIIVTGQGNFFMDIIGFVASIGMLVFAVMSSVKTSLAYGKGVAFALGLLFLPNIFYLILGFGDARYRGPQV